MNRKISALFIGVAVFAGSFSSASAVAKDLVGNVMATKDVNLTISR